MSSTTTKQQFRDAETRLPEPHFDEEATVLSARPVVPLDEVESLKSKTSLPRPWILGLGLGCALLVGVLATVIYYSRSNEGDLKLVDGAEVAAGVEGNSTGPSNSFSGPAAPQPKVDNERSAEVSRHTPVRNQPADGVSAEAGKKPRARLVAVIKEKSNNHIDEESYEDQRAARKQARQERRRAVRDKREGRSSDELLRIRDIFEGSPRP